MSDVAEPTRRRSPHPIHLVVTDDLQRNRLTVLFRLLLAIPRVRLGRDLWAIAAGSRSIVAWFAGLFLGRVPDGLHNFIAAFVRYQTHVYAYFSIAAEPVPVVHRDAGLPRRRRDRAGGARRTG